MKVRFRAASGRPAFTLVELLVSMAVMALVLTIVFAVVSEVSSLWRRTTGAVGTFREARTAFELLTRSLSQATMNTYWDYDPPFGNASGASPGSYKRASELHMVMGPGSELLAGVPDFSPVVTGDAVFFVAPSGASGAGNSASNVLSAMGYFLINGTVGDTRPAFIRALQPQAERYRLMEFRQPSGDLSIFRPTLDELKAAGAVSLRRDWFTRALVEDPGLARPVAENIVALVLWAQRSNDSSGPVLTGDYAYDTRAYMEESGIFASQSRNQLPPIIHVTLVAVDETAASRIEQMSPAERAILDPDALFTTLAGSTLEDQVASYQADLRTLTEFLVDHALSHRVFTTKISLRQAKWSEE